MPKLEEPEAAVAVPVWAWKLPVPINNKLTKASAALTTLYGEDVWMTQMGRHMIDLPRGIPMYTNDTMALATQLGIAGQLPKQAGRQHDALQDARHVKTMHEYLRSFL